MANRFTAVWADNFAQEIAAVDRFLTHFPIVSFDAEFPGFLRNTPRSASDALRYQDLRFNVDSLKLIQLGITLFDDLGNIGGTWEFNFRGFDEETDPHVADSITLLKANGLDLEKFRKFGIDPEVFEEGFAEVLRMHRGRLLWVSFHGLYDSAYVMKLMTRKAMPSSPTEFAAMAGNLFERGISTFLFSHVEDFDVLCLHETKQQNSISGFTVAPRNSRSGGALGSFLDCEQPKQSLNDSYRFQLHQRCSKDQWELEECVESNEFEIESIKYDRHESRQ
ncbi:putative CCR4-associated factor 1 homolog 8 isoform X3 [Malus sylvestris]|uniref:putative CCR4-associated factor 1 homolog 8 isoform X3 n=1 Tax=Malus sylvestris TaxID=3752 RepID=UPI0021ACA97C|nr:putative CCR4-associated factor 1 homolog 8 isoform X3 [Malus sylvestris]